MNLPIVRRVFPLLAAVSLLLLAAPGDASAQQRGVVTGIVVAAENLRPLVSAQVYFPALQLGVLTNAQGRFLIQNVPVGEHEITAERIGFRQIRQTVVVRAGETVAVDFRLEERAISMEGIVVTGVAAETPQTQVPFTVAKVNVDEVPELAAQFGVLNIPTLIFFKGGEEVDRVVGSQPKSQLEAKIQHLTG